MHPVSRLTAFALLLSLSACADPEKELEPKIDSRPYAQAVRQAEQDWAWISGTEWVLVNIEGQAPIAQTRSTLAFQPEETWMFGSTGCNRFTGDYIRRGADGIEIGPLITTKIFCAYPAGVMQQESRLLHLLDMADTYTATRERLAFSADGVTILVYHAATPQP